VKKGMSYNRPLRTLRQTAHYITLVGTRYISFIASLAAHLQECNSYLVTHLAVFGVSNSLREKGKIKLQFSLFFS
jgi:hypothetical protein